MNVNQFMSESRVLSEKIELPEEAFEVVGKVAKKVFEKKEAEEFVRSVDDEIQSGKRGDFGKAKELGEMISVLDGEACLFLCFFSALTAKKRYEGREISMDIYYTTMRDIMIWAKTYHSHYGVWGLEQYGWVSNSLNLGLFRIGRLQFQPWHYEGPVYTHAGVTVKPGDPMLNIHIPEDGPFSQEERIKSYKDAYKFFGQTGNAVYACESYLFYEKHREFLWEGSNILGFMNEFHMVENREYADDYSNMWRIFGFLDSYDDVAKLPKNTKLQRAIAELIEKYHALGAATGVMIFDGNEIL